MSTIFEIFKIKEPFNTWRGLWQYSIRIFIAILIIDIAAVPLINALFSKLVSFKIFLFSFVILLFYWFIFLINRLWLKIIFSNKTNIVLAYNLMGINYSDYEKKYQSFIAILKNKINEHNLGRKIKIIKCPADITFEDESAAEAKIKLGLTGSTLLVWGYVVKEKGRERFKTKFSYEFGYPKRIKESDAKRQFREHIEKVINRGLFGLDRPPIRIDANVFSENTLETSLYILGVTTASMGLTEKAVIFLSEFRKFYYSSDILRQKTMGPAVAEAEEILVAINMNLIQRIFSESPKRLNEIRSYCENILKINKNHYLANIALSYYYHEVEKDKPKAISFNNIAANNAPPKLHNHIFNEAFFALDEGDYLKAVRLYETIPSKTNVNIMQLREFLGRYFEKTKNLAFLFAEGFIFTRWSDTLEGKIEGKKILKNFIKKAKKNQLYIFLVQKA